ncbi:MAG: helix-turn-helix transcriptional regulator [Bryobacteraceae bacterium]|nr:helix-turn-helix transcriptional regulator [Bryobacteraceae bacterium]
MEFRVLSPSPRFASQVECYWVLEGTGGPQTFLPDGCMELIFHYGDPFLHNGAMQQRGLLIGQMRSPVTVSPAGRAGVFGVRFRPGGAFPLLRFKQREAAGCLQDCDLILGAALRERIANACGDRERVGLIEAALPDHATHWVDDVLRDMTARRGAVEVDALARSAGVSARQLERAFDERVGLSPKTLARILRFRAALQEGSRPGATWADVAQACGYFDQSHLIRDFREFAGAPPAMSDFSKTANLPRE